MMSGLESANMLIVRHPHPSSSGGQTVPSFQPLTDQQQQQQQQPGLAGSSVAPVSGLSCSIPAGTLDTIQEDTSIESHPGEEGPPGDESTTGAACSSDTRSSYEDLTEQSPGGRERRRLHRQACVDTKETEC